MAHGLLCKHCGQQETDHELGPQIEEHLRNKPSYRMSLFDCPGFELSKKNQRTHDREVERGARAGKREADFFMYMALYGFSRFPIKHSR
jgi:hypothetical protein